MIQSLLITSPDDWHTHFRDDEALQHTVLDTASNFARALAMPNLTTPVTTLALLQAYRQRILKVCDPTVFEPYFTFYLNQSVDLDELYQTKQYPFILGGKLYPAGATTNSAQGVTSIQALYPTFEVMQDVGLVLQIHGETTSGDIFDREVAFIQHHLRKLIKNFPRLRVVLEHISTKTAVEFILEAPQHVAATITPHHLLFNRNHFLVGGVHPHYYCLPLLKREQDQIALQQAATSGNPRFFAGTDSAPHAKSQKESACGCAGIYSAPYALAMYAQIFDDQHHLDRLEAFTSRFGADFYQLPYNQTQIELIKQPQVIPSTLPLGHTTVVPLAAGDTLSWSMHVKSS